MRAPALHHFACVLLGLAACNKAPSSSDEAPSDGRASAAPTPKMEVPAATASPDTDGKPSGKWGGETIGGDTDSGGHAGKSHRGKKPRASVRAASTSSMTGRLTEKAVESVVADNIDKFAPCAESDVTVSLRALVSETGKIVSATASRSSPDEARVRDCVVSAFKTLELPASPEGKPAPIAFDLVLSAS